MSAKSFVWSMRLLFLFGLVMTTLIVLFFSPYQNQSEEINLWSVVAFHFFLLLGLSGIFSNFMFWLRRKNYEKELLCAHLGVSFRQGLLLGLVVVIMLILQSFQVLVWWDALLTVAAVLMVELYFLAR